MTALPSLRIESVWKAFDDGAHDAFTDLCRFQGRLYLTFRSCPDGHGVSPNAKVVVLASDDDGAQWEPVFEFCVQDRDTRDPHFLVFRDTLFVYTGTWLCDPARPERRDLNDHLGYAAWSLDGRAWSGPQCLEGTYGHYVWRAAVCGDKAYLCGRRRRNFQHNIPGESEKELIQSAMLESDDGLVWKTAALFAESYGDETAFLFEDDGSVIALVRGAGEPATRLCRAKPPYRDWTRVDLGVFIGGPLLTQWAGRYLVGGRRMTEDRGPKTVLYWLVGDQLHQAAELPSAGDNSYPGFVPFSDREGLLSYYSTHEGPSDQCGSTSIFLARLALEA